MNGKKITLTYLQLYLAVGGIGLALFPSQTLSLFFSTGNYGDIMPRVTGMFMCALSFLIFNIVKNEDWKYYVTSIYVRSAIVLFLFWMYSKSLDPMFLVLIVIVLIGLIPSMIIHFKKDQSQK